MGTDCIDVVDKLMEVMCLKCPRYSTNCKPEKEDSYHSQMLVCMGSLQDRLDGKYPAEDEIDQSDEGEGEY